MIDWQLWAPPLDPPAGGGLPFDVAQDIADQWWACDPYEAAALMWTYYALMSPTEADVVSVTTGAQSVAYSGPGSRFALAMARADWFRSQGGSLISVPLRLAYPDLADLPVDWWQRNLEHPP